jgi:hypothetical protein
LGRRI